MLKHANEKDYEVLNDWIKPCTNHLHWSATTLSSGDGNLMFVKFNVFLSHILNKHEHFEIHCLISVHMGIYQEKGNTWLKLTQHFY